MFSGRKVCGMSLVRYWQTHNRMAIDEILSSVLGQLCMFA